MTSKIKKFAVELLQQVREDVSKIETLESALYATAAAKEANKPVADAAAAKVASLEATAVALGIHEDAPADEITTATDKVDAIKAERKEEAATDPVEVDFAALDVVTVDEPADEPDTGSKSGKRKHK